MKGRHACEAVRPGNLRSTQIRKHLAEEDFVKLGCSSLPAQPRHRLCHEVKLTSRSHSGTHVSGGGRRSEDNHKTQKELMKAFPSFQTRVKSYWQKSKHSRLLFASSSKGLRHCSGKLESLKQRPPGERSGQ